MGELAEMALPEAVSAATVMGAQEQAATVMGTRVQGAEGKVVGSLVAAAA